MSTDPKHREAHEKGQKEADYIRDHPVSFLFTGGVEPRPSDPDEGAAYDKGLARERLDADKK